MVESTKNYSKTTTKAISSTLISTNDRKSFDSVSFPYRYPKIQTMKVIIPTRTVALLISTFSRRAVQGRLL